MDTIMMLVLMTGCIIGICLLLTSNEKRQNTKHVKKLMKEFSERASLHGMNFTSQEMFENCLLGLDGVKRQLLILHSSEVPHKETHIHLAEVKRCVAKHHFRRAYEKNTDHVGSANCCSLVFEFFGGKTIEVLFENEAEDLTNLKEMSSKTRKWAMLLSKMLPNQQDDPPRSMPIAC